jgi:RNA polymerase sigma-70 factor (ECF subfamily)
MDKEIQNIWTDLHQELEKFILSKVKDKYLTKGILQDVFLKIQLNVHTLKDCSKLTSWVYQVTRNVISDYFRKTNCFVSIETLDFPEQEEEPLFEALANCINSKINNLPKNYKEAILLTTLKDFSQVELAEHLGISYSGTKSRVQRGKEKLKELVADCKNVETDEFGNIVDYNSEM